MTAANGQEAVDAYMAACYKHLAAEIETSANSSTQPPQVILMDINMPVLNGFEATRAIRAFEKQHNLPATRIIALTGLGDAAAHQEAFASGVDFFLTKPVSLKELGAILDRIEEKIAGVANEAKT